MDTGPRIEEPAKGLLPEDLEYAGLVFGRESLGPKNQGKVPAIPRVSFGILTRPFVWLPLFSPASRKTGGTLTNLAPPAPPIPRLLGGTQGLNPSLPCPSLGNFGFRPFPGTPGTRERFFWTRTPQSTIFQPPRAKLAKNRGPPVVPTGPLEPGGPILEFPWNPGINWDRWTGNRHPVWAEFLICQHSAQPAKDPPCPPGGNQIRSAPGGPAGLSLLRGGKTTGTHIHIARKYNGEWIIADSPLPFNMEGWIPKNGVRAYEGTLVKNGYTVKASPVSDAASQISSGN